MVKNAILYLFVLILANYLSFADATYPYSIEFMDFYDGGKLFIADSNIENFPKFYFIKTSWINDGETIYSWDGLDRKSSKGENIGDDYIISATMHHNKMWIVSKVENKIYISNYSNKNNSSFSNKVIIDSTSYSPYFYSQSNGISNNNNIRWFCKNNVKNIFLLIGTKLFSIEESKNTDSFSVNFINDKVISCEFIDNKNGLTLAYVEDRNDFGIINLLDTLNFSHFSVRIPITENILLYNLEKYFISGNSTIQNETLISIIDILNNNIFISEWINTNANLIKGNNNSNSLFALINDDNNYFLSKISITDVVTLEQNKRISLPKHIYSPIKIDIIDKYIVAIFSNAVAIYDTNLNEVLFDYFEFNKFINSDVTIKFFKQNDNNYLLLSSLNSSMLFKMKNNSLWFINKQIKNTYRSAVPIILIFIIFFFYRKYRNQKRIFDALIELPTSGFVFSINKAGKLISVNEGGKRILNINDYIPLRKQFNYYCSTPQTKEISDLIENGLVNRIAFQQKINIIEDNNPREWLCSLIPLRNIAGRFRGVILSGIDITEELERQMLTNWAQLAHDMQTNLTTIRLNIEQINSAQPEDIQRKNKILHQVSILVHRIKDIVIVGREDQLVKSLVNSIEFCNEIRNEFDINIFTKIKFKMDLTDFNFICDKPKLLRAVRNAVENSLKYMKGSGGFITISCSKDIHFIRISVKDTGIGMDETTKNKIFTPFFSTARKSGGYGIGTMIMQRVAELHGGKLLIESEAGEGTEITFLLPDLTRKEQLTK